MNSVEQLAHITELLSGASVNDILFQNCNADALEAIDNYILGNIDTTTPSFGFVLPPYITEHFLESTDAWLRIRDYCADRLGDDLRAPAYLLECFLQLYETESSVARIGQNVVKRDEPSLIYDEDGLLVGPRNKIVFSKEGVLTAERFILYHRGVPGAGLSDGFVEALLAREARGGSSQFGLAIDPDCILARSLHHVGFTRAYIRGPKGISEEVLQDPGFPPDARGTVTMHQRVGDNPLYRLFPLIRMEIMWSRRGTLKTVQMEELIPPGSSRVQQPGVILNRYVHAIWDTTIGTFTHFDGALRGYNIKTYDGRLATDLKKFSWKPLKYQKMFRIDCKLSIDDWSDLVVRFYQENELALEYLGGPRSREDVLG
jgi:hypothetical protein